MSWKLIFSRSAQKHLRKLPLSDRRRIDRALDQLAIEPLEGDVRPLRNQPAEFRLRVGDYRVFFDLEHPERQIRVHDVSDLLLELRAGDPASPGADDRGDQGDRLGF